MKIETYEQRILIPDEGCWLYNADEHIISDKVYLGKTAKEDKWVEITSQQKLELE